MDLLAGLANAHPINILTSDKEKHTADFLSFSSPYLGILAGSVQWDYRNLFTVNTSLLLSETRLMRMLS